MGTNDNGDTPMNIQDNLFEGDHTVKIDPPVPATTSGDTTETVAEFQWGGKTYQIDHLGITHDNQWGEYVVFLNGRDVSYFSTPGARLKPEFRNEPPSTAELIDLAERALATDEAHDFAGDNQ